MLLYGFVLVHFIYGLFWSHSTCDPCTLQYQCLRLILSSSFWSIYPTFLKKRNEYLHLPPALDSHKTRLPHWKKGREEGLRREGIFLKLLTLFFQTFHNHLIYKVKGKTKSIYRPVTTGWPPLRLCYWPPFSAGGPTAEMQAGITALDLYQKLFGVGR